MADTEAAAAPVVTFKKRAKNTNLRKRAATPPPGSDEEEEYSSQDETGGRTVKRRRKAGAITASSISSKQQSEQGLSTARYSADRSTNIASTNDATKQRNWYDEKEDDDLSAQNLLGKTRSKPAQHDDHDEEARELDGKYKGTAAYGNFIKKNTNAPDKKFGPMKAASNIRTITITDFAPDVCKDYKQTGFCGFGDSCKFLHAREDYKQGWALDNEWQKQGKKSGGTIVASANKNLLAKEDEENEADAALLEKIPFACILCKKPYTSPVVTKCGHYFCEACALKRYAKKPDCAACGVGTNGIFNVAKDLKKLLERKKSREERLKKLAEEEAAEKSEEDG